MTYFNSFITKRQINVIFAKAKAGQLKVERWVMESFYDIADFQGIDYNGTTQKTAAVAKGIIDSIFAGKMEEAQKQINNFTAERFELFGKKRQAEANRNFI